MTIGSLAAQPGAAGLTSWLTAWSARPVAFLVLLNAVLLPGGHATSSASGRRSSLRVQVPTEEVREARAALAKKSQEFEDQSAQLTAERKRSAHLAHEVEQLSQKLKVEENKEFVLQRKLRKVRSDLLNDLDNSENVSTKGVKDAPHAAVEAPETPTHAPPAPTHASLASTHALLASTHATVEPTNAHLAAARASPAPAHTPPASSKAALLHKATALRGQREAVRSQRLVVHAGSVHARAGQTGSSRVGTGKVRAANADSPRAGTELVAVKASAGNVGAENGGGTVFDRLEEKLHEEDERIQALDSESIPDGSEGAAAEERAPESALEGASIGTDETTQPATGSAEPPHQASFVQTPVAMPADSLPSPTDSSDVSDMPPVAAATDTDAPAIDADAPAVESGGNEVVPLEAEEAGPDALPAEVKTEGASGSSSPQDVNGEAAPVDVAMNVKAADAASASGDMKAVLDSTVSSEDEAFLSQMAPGAAGASSA